MSKYTELGKKYFELRKLANEVRKQNLRFAKQFFDALKEFFTVDESLISVFTKDECVTDLEQFGKKMLVSVIHPDKHGLWHFQVSIAIHPEGNKKSHPAEVSHFNIAVKFSPETSLLIINDESFEISKEDFSRPCERIFELIHSGYEERMSFLNDYSIYN